MKLLLDTHVFLWWVLDDARLSSNAKQLMGKRDSDLYVSTASVWEMVIKIRIGKLSLPDLPLDFISEQLRINRISPLPVFLDHAMAVHHLPLLHRDPFDRMLVAQAMSENMPIISSDEWISKYNLKVIW